MQSWVRRSNKIKKEKDYCSLYSIYVSTNNERGKKIVYM